MHRLAPALMALALTLPGAFAQAQPAPVQPVATQAAMPEGISHFTLDNGLDVVVIEDHRAPVVVQMVWYRIGSADESPGKSGLAHYLEHLMFKGTERLGPGELSRTVTANGGMDNAFTSYDYTAYFQRIAADRLDLVMGMEADRMQNLRIGEDDWQAERQVVLEERAQRTDSDPAAQFGEERRAVQFYNHPYGRPVIGWRDEMEGLTRQDALDWYAAHYAPDNAILILAGDVTAQAARELAQRHYGPIPAAGHDRDRIRPQEPPQRSPRRIEMVDARTAQPVFYRTILAPERNAGDQRPAAALTMLAELLGGQGATSVLGQALVMGGQAVHMRAHYDGLAVDPTSFTLVMVPAPGLTPEDAESALDAALADFLQEGVDPDRLARVRQQIHAGEVYARDSAHARAYDYGQGLATGLGVQDVNDWPAILTSITPAEVEAAAHDLLTSTATVSGWLLPPDLAGADAAHGDEATEPPVTIPPVTTPPATASPATAPEAGTADAAAPDTAMPEAGAADGSQSGTVTPDATPDSETLLPPVPETAPSDQPPSDQPPSDAALSDESPDATTHDESPGESPDATPSGESPPGEPASGAPGADQPPIPPEDAP